MNTVCEKFGTKNVILISVHCNAAGSGQWMNARGWEAWTSVGETKADELATCLYREAEKAGFKIRKDMTDGDPDKEAHFYILKHTKCPAVLTENLFQDNREDVAYLLSKTGKKTIVGASCQRHSELHQRQLTMKRVLIFISLMFLLGGCGTTRRLTETTHQQDSVRVEVQTRTEYVKDTVYLEIPAQTAERTTADSTSHLENDYAVSDARIKP